jgi:hypothetical protein
MVRVTRESSWSRTVRLWLAGGIVALLAVSALRGDGPRANDGAAGPLSAP